MEKVLVRTIQSPDGVLGLNGWWYLLDEDDNPIRFNGVEEAMEYIEDNGGDPHDEYTEYIEEEWAETDDALDNNGRG